MSRSKKYFDILKEIKKESEEEGVELSENIVIAMMKEIGKDSRTPNYNENHKKEPISEPATVGQVNVLKKIGKYKDGISKNEAWHIINEQSRNNKKTNVEEIKEEVY